MATLINPAALTFYAEDTHVTPVTGGTSAGDTLYPKLDDSFGFVGEMVAYMLPFTGRGILTVNKTFTCGASVKPFIANLVGTEALNQVLSDANILSWSGQGQVSYDAENKMFVVPKYAGVLVFSFFANSALVNFATFLDNGPAITQYKIDTLNASIPVNGQRTTYNIPEDKGLLSKYEILVSISFPENTTTQTIDRGWIEFFNSSSNFDSTNSLLYDNLYFNQEGEAISLNKTSIGLNVYTGVGETVIVSADDNWTIS